MNTGHQREMMTINLYTWDLKDHGKNYLKKTNGYLHKAKLNCRTPLHVDVFSSYSWSTNVCGKKNWILYPPGSEEKLKTVKGDLPYQKQLDLEQTSYGFFVEQNAGETIFVPTGWHHQVWNMVNHIFCFHLLPPGHVIFSF